MHHVSGRLFESGPTDGMAGLLPHDDTSNIRCKFLIGSTAPRRRLRRAAMGTGKRSVSSVSGWMFFSGKKIQFRIARCAFFTCEPRRIQYSKFICVESLPGRGLSAGREVVFSTTIGQECVELQKLHDFP